MFIMILYIFSYLFILILIPIFDVFLKNVKNILNWRKTMSLFQTYFDLIKLFKKTNFKSQFTSFFNFLAPLLILTSSLLFLFFIPTISNILDTNIFILFHILWLSSVFLMLYALDNATYFWWLWAARESFVLALTEPLIILVIMCFVIISWWNMNLLSISNAISLNTDPIICFFIITLWINLFAILLAENKRFPFDNPSTHLELTMIHEAMLLETNWSKLAIMEIASKVTLFWFINLIIFLFWNNFYWVSNIFWMFWILLWKIAVILIIIAFFEVFITKIRLFRYQNVFSFLLVLELIMLLFVLLK